MDSDREQDQIGFVSQKTKYQPLRLKSTPGSAVSKPCNPLVCVIGDSRIGFVSQKRAVLPEHQNTGTPEPKLASFRRNIMGRACQENSTHPLHPSYPSYPVKERDETFLERMSRMRRIRRMGTARLDGRDQKIGFVSQYTTIDHTIGHLRTSGPSAEKSPEHGNTG